MATVTAEHTGQDTNEGEAVETTVPARLDRLPWSRWHWMILIGLGTVWILDGLEVTIVGSIGRTLTKAGAASTSPRRRSATPPACTWPERVSGRCSSASSPTGSAGDGCSWSPWACTWRRPWRPRSHATRMFFVFRFLTGMGIGGEYAAINSAIDELIPARRPGHGSTSSINGTYWAGTAAGAAATLVRPRPPSPRRSTRLAGLLRARRRPRPGDPAGPAECPGEPPLAVHPRPRPRRPRTVDEHRAAGRAGDRRAAATSPTRRSRSGSASDRASSTIAHGPCSATYPRRRSSASRCSSARRSSTTRSCSATRRS